MLLELIQFEIRSRLRQPGMWAVFALFALLAFAAVTTDAVRVGGGSGQTAINSPLVIAQLLGTFSVIGVLVITAFVATSVVRDYEQRTYAAFYTSPIRKHDFVLGRFAGSSVAAAIVLFAPALGMALGTLMPWLDAERVVDFHLMAYLQPLFVLVIPNTLIMGAVFFAVGTLTRRILYAYIAVAAMFVIYVVSQDLLSGIDNDTIAALADPFGMSALSVDTRYWTVAERNSQVPTGGMILLVNRGVWLAVGAATVVFTTLRFSMGAPLEQRRATNIEKDVAVRSPTREPLPQVTLATGKGLALLQCLRQTRVEVRGLVRSTAFAVITLFCCLNALGGIVAAMDTFFGTPVYPVTHLMVSMVSGTANLFILIVIVFYAGDLVWKERQVGMHELYDAFPVPSWVPVAAQTTALALGVFVLLLACTATAIGVQLWSGYTDLQLDLYLSGMLGIQWWRWIPFVLIAVAFQGLANRKYVGFALVVGLFVMDVALPTMGFGRSLYLFGDTPSTPYSDMNGYGHFLPRMVWYHSYWSLFAFTILIVAGLLWPRGTDARMGLRLRIARTRLAHGPVRWGLASTTLGVVAIGGNIFYNTDILNHYRSEDQQEDAQVAYEQRYKQYENLPQPRVIASDVTVELYPTARQADLSGVLTLQNKTDAPIPEVHVTLDADLNLRRLALANGTLYHDDTELGYRIYRIDPPLLPGATTELEFDVGFAEPGFVEAESNTEVVYNGSFLHNTKYIPVIGYIREAELSDRNDRRDHGLPERARMADLDDKAAAANNYLSQEADWIRFSATVGTDLDQIALAPGYLQREWTQGQRRYRRFEMAAPILNFYSFLSARWQVRTAKWNDVALEVYYHPPHGRNVDRMLEAAGKSLDYFSAAFGPYQHRQVRIVEFPRYSTYAQSFPNTIPYSESLGFIADLRDPESIDYVFYVTAHEVAHQWWGHQVVGANVQGSTILSETLAQYSALMVMEQEYGRDQMGKFLKYELDRYLGSRGAERDKELPLLRVENQPYIHYNKGSLAMYALREYIGEDKVNGVLAELIQQYRFSGPPYPTSRDLVDRLRAACPSELKYLVEDLFETITLYDNRAVAARSEQLGDGRWKVTLDATAAKFRADEQGHETAVPLNDLIEVGVLIEETVDGVTKRRPLLLEKRRLTEDAQTLEFIVDEQPSHAGIDPRVLLVDRDPDDNIRAVD